MENGPTQAGKMEDGSLQLEIQQQEYPTMYSKLFLVQSKSELCVLLKPQSLQHLGKHNQFLKK